MIANSQPSASVSLTRYVVFTKLAAASTAVVALWLAGCGGNPLDPQPSATASDCVGCHTDEALLRKVARSETPPVEDAGEG